MTRYTTISCNLATYELDEGVGVVVASDTAPVAAGVVVVAAGASIFSTTRL